MAPAGGFARGPCAGSRFRTGPSSVHRYRLFDCTLASELACPGLPGADGEADVSLRLGVVPESLDRPVGGGVCYSAAPGEFLFSLPGIGRFLLRDGTEIRVDPAAGIGDADLRLFLLNLVAGALLLQRGEFLLHAAVVETGDGCIALAGDSGAGKSTLAASLQARGWRVLSDEFCLIRSGPGGEPRAVPGPPFLQLWADAVQRLGHDPATLEPLRPGLQKYLLPLDAEHPTESRPLRAVWVLSMANNAEVETQTLSGSEGLETLLRQSYRIDYLKPMGLAAAHFGKVLALSRAVPVHRLRTPGTSSSIEAMIERLTAAHRAPAPRG